MQPPVGKPPCRVSDVGFGKSAENLGGSGCFRFLDFLGGRKIEYLGCFLVPVCLLCKGHLFAKNLTNSKLQFRHFRFLPWMMRLQSLPSPKSQPTVPIAATKLLSDIFAQLHNVFDSCLVGTTKGEHCMHKIHKGDLASCF